LNQNSKPQKRISIVGLGYVDQGNYYSTYDFHKEMYETPWWVLGGDGKDCDYVKDIILPIVGPQKKWFYLSALEAELVKDMENFYFAIKMTFANEIYEACKEFDISYEKVGQNWGGRS
jgi:UDP-N-acetyl-D-mannosaminuronate dehydrogenase